MPRQIVPVSDVASILLTQDEGDLRYLPISYSPPPVDLSLYYTKVQSDARYEPLDSAYTKAEADAKYLTQALGDVRYQPVGSYSLTSHLHTGVYQPVGDYAYTSHNHTDTYVDVTGDVMSGELTTASLVTPQIVMPGVNSSIDIGQNPGVNTPFIDFHSSASSNDFDARIICSGGSGVSAQGNLQINSGDCYFSGTMYGAQTLSTGTFTCRDTIYCTNYIMSGNGAAAYCWYTPSGPSAVGGNLTLSASSNIMLSAPGSYIHPHADAVVNLGHPGIRWSNVYAMQYLAYTGVSSADWLRAGSNDGNGQHIVVNYHQLIKYGGGHIQVALAGNFEPATDNSCLLGGSVNRWQSVWSNTGSIQTSHAVAKKNFSLLDPAACVEAVLGTDWLSYEYLPPVAPPPVEGETPKQRLDALDEYMLEAAKTYPSRKQNGYVLGHPTHKVHDLFGQPDRESASPSSDLGILACALQAALQRIAALESLQGVTA